MHGSEHINHDNPPKCIILESLKILFAFYWKANIIEEHHKKWVVGETYYIPHHLVIITDKTTAKESSLTRQHRRMVQACLMSLFYKHFNVY